MKHYCIFEFNNDTKRHKFICTYGEDYNAANEMSQSMNNFRQNATIYYFVRCLEQNEFDNIKHYNPFNYSMKIKKDRV